MLFGTTKKLTKCGKDLELVINGNQIANTPSYKYLGTTLESNLSLSTNFDKMFKKTNAKLRMLFSLRKNLDQNALNKIYKGMILLCVTYNCTINLNLTQTQLQKLQNIDRMAMKVTGEQQPVVLNEIKKHSIMLVRKCLENQTCENFNDYFTKQLHDRVTRNNGFSLKVPKTKLKYAQCGF